MKGVIREVSAAELARRKRLGLDRWDVRWEGVLHRSPAPSYEHQRIVDELLLFLGPGVKKKRGILRCGINVFRAEDDYRIPDLTFVAAGRERIIAEDGIRGGGPDAVIEIRSPDDETCEKFPFFAALGTREFVVIDRDTKKPEIYRLAGPQFLAIAADREGWVTSETLRVRVRLLAGEKPCLALQDLDDPTTRVEI